MPYNGYTRSIKSWAKMPQFFSKIFLAAAVFASAPAFAEGHVQTDSESSIAIHGSYTAAMYIVNDDTKDVNKSTIKQEGFISFQGQHITQNGLIAGMQVDILVFSNPDDQIDDHFLFLQGAFGKVEIGGTPGVMHKMGYTSPWFTPGNGVDDPDFINNHTLGDERYGLNTTLLPTSTLYGLSNYAYKINYMTPRINGVQLGMSYTPSSIEPNSSRPQGLPLQSALQFHWKNVTEFSANYSQSMEMMDLNFSAAYQRAKPSTKNLKVVRVVDGALVENTIKDASLWRLGAEAATSNFTFGVGYLKASNAAVMFNPARGAENSPTVPTPLGFKNCDLSTTTAHCALVNREESDRYFQNDMVVLTYGVSYQVDDYTFGIAHLEGKTKRYLDFSQARKWTMMQFGANYQISNGIDVALSVERTQDKLPSSMYFVQPLAQTVENTANKDTAIGLLLMVNF